MIQFNKCAGESAKKQQTWLEFASKLNEMYLEIKNQNLELKAECKDKGLLVNGAQGVEESDLATDLKIEGLACIDRIPQVGEIRKIKEKIFDEGDLALKENNVEANIEGLTT
jgi:hypothetical protein